MWHPKAAAVPGYLRSLLACALVAGLAGMAWLRPEDLLQKQMQGYTKALVEYLKTQALLPIITSGGPEVGGCL